ncbi:hypothetical protein [Caulobacter sp. S45]|uniref:hypothetical protein n=1 Tax=Caulobacter sp. S45 TaxID=1641861 RepID=UPI00131E8874|nr:hypothetical protein [Caulobacter sp. S45]
MKSGFLVITVLAAACLASCSKQSTQVQTHHGRFAGVGIYSPGELWSKMAGAANLLGEPATAKITDDEHVIVVVDSDTGEIRQCGDLSGYCVGVNPWTKSLLKSQALPVNLTAHAAETRAAAGSLQASRGQGAAGGSHEP